MTPRHRASVICVHREELLVCRFCDPGTKKVMLVVPGGAIDPGEEPHETAKRETLEETGYTVSVDQSSAFVSEYPFEWDGKLYQCTTHWFCADLNPEGQKPAPVDDASYNWGPGWLPLEDLDTAFSYNAHILDCIRKGFVV